MGNDPPHMAGTGQFTLDAISEMLKIVQDHQEDVQFSVYLNPVEYAHYRKMGMIGADGRIDLPVYGKVSVELTKPLPKLKSRKRKRR